MYIHLFVNLFTYQTCMYSFIHFSTYHSPPTGRRHRRYSRRRHPHRRPHASCPGSSGYAIHG